MSLLTHHLGKERNKQSNALIKLKQQIHIENRTQNKDCLTTKRANIPRHHCYFSSTRNGSTLQLFLFQDKVPRVTECS